ncbi:MAG: DUF3795 domain-containing protein [Puniceicoccaceae bacterium]
MKPKNMNRRTFVNTTVCAGCAFALTGFVVTENNKADLGAYCGLYCGTCRMYTGGKCTGCKGPVETMAAHCQKCKIRPCAEEKGVKSCAECAEFPCDKIKAFHNPDKPMGRKAAANCEAIKSVGYDKWLAQQAKN